LHNHTMVGFGNNDSVIFLRSVVAGTNHFTLRTEA
jgi:hypothetical protein